MLMPTHSAECFQIRIRFAGAHHDRPRSRTRSKKLIRNFNEVELEHDTRAPLYDSMCARLALGTVARKLGASVDTVAAGKMSCLITHIMRKKKCSSSCKVTAPCAWPIRMCRSKPEMSFFIPPGPEYPHQLINTSDAPLQYLSISTRDTPEIVEYPDSDKFQASVTLTDGTRFVALQRRGQNLDYWDGEP